MTPGLQRRFTGGDLRGRDSRAVDQSGKEPEESRSYPRVDLTAWVKEVISKGTLCGVAV